MFQSTHPHGVRPYQASLFEETGTVSIHAPTRGATQLSNCPNYLRLSFNPRTHTGCDHHIRYHSYGLWWFQSTHPHGVRPNIYLNFAFNITFQSTHPHGVRPRFLFCSLQSSLVSIHAPTRGATQFEYFLFACLSVSIHAPTRGATHLDQRERNQQEQFQSTHPHGVRHRLLMLIIRFVYSFNPRTHTGCDHR